MFTFYVVSNSKDVLEKFKHSELSDVVAVRTDVENDNILKYTAEMSDAIKEAVDSMEKSNGKKLSLVVVCKDNDAVERVLSGEDKFAKPWIVTLVYGTGHGSTTSFRFLEEVIDEVTDFDKEMSEYFKKLL